MALFLCWISSDYILFVLIAVIQKKLLKDFSLSENVSGNEH